MTDVIKMDVRVISDGLTFVLCNEDLSDMGASAVKDAARFLRDLAETVAKETQKSEVGHGTV